MSWTSSHPLTGARRRKQTGSPVKVSHGALHPGNRTCLCAVARLCWTWTPTGRDTQTWSRQGVGVLTPALLLPGWTGARLRAPVPPLKTGTTCIIELVSRLND